MKNIFIILLFLFVNTSLFSNDMAIKLLENSYKQLNKDLLECQVEEKHLFKQSSIHQSGAQSTSKIMATLEDVGVIIMPPSHKKRKLFFILHQRMQICETK